ncbi:hypothetical protein Tco_1010589 [Tanacetum coccineum]
MEAANSSIIICDSEKKNENSVDTCNKCLELKVELVNKNDVYIELSKCDNQNHPEIQEYFEQNDLKAQLQAKDTVISKLNETIHSLRENVNPAKVKKDIDEIETINIELEHNLKTQIQEKVFAKATLKNKLRKVKEKIVIDTVVSKPHATTIALGMFKLNLEPLALKDNALVNKKLVEITWFVTPKNKDKKVRFADPITSSNNTQKQVDSHKPKDSNQPLLHSTGVIGSTGASKSNPIGNTKNNRISQSSSSNKTNKVEDQSRSVKSRKNKKNHAAKTKSNAYVMQSMLNANSKYVVQIVMWVYYVRGLRHNLFSVGQLCDLGLEVAFRKHTCFVRNLEGVDLLMGSWGTNLYTLSIGDIMKSSPICLLSKASKTKSSCHNLLHPEPFPNTPSSWKTPYELLHDRKPDLSYLHLFGAICYPTNDSEDLGKLKAKPDVDFDELTAMAAEQSSSGPTLHEMTPGTLSLGLVPQPPSSTPFVPPIRDDWDTLLQPLFHEYFHPPPCVDHPVPEVAALVFAVSTGSPSSTLVDQDAPSLGTSKTLHASLSHAIPLGAKEADHDIEVVHMDNKPQSGIPIPESSSEESSSQVDILNNVHSINQPPEHISKWTKDYPIDNVIGDPSRPVSTRHQLQNEALFCYFDAFLSSVEHKSYKEAITESYWIEAMQEELNEFEFLKVWELVPCPVL